MNLYYLGIKGYPLGVTVRATFGLRRFSSLLNHLRFDDKSTRSERRKKDIFAPFRDCGSPFTEIWPNSSFQVKILHG